MPVKRPPLVNNEIYHIVNRTVDTIKLFRTERDYFRMIHNLFEFNDENPADWNYRHKVVSSNAPRTVLGALENKGKNKRKREVLVEILGFCLMPNHIHLLVRQTQDKGISKFMRKIGAGYGKYYNIKYKRNGHVFQGRFRAVHIKTTEQLKTIFVYIHTNPISLILPKWKEKGIKKLDKATSFLENYRWSSYPDYLGRNGFPSITKREFLLETMNGNKGCKELVNSRLV